MYKGKPNRNKKNMVWELNRLLASSLPTPINLVIYRLRGLTSLQYEKGLLSLQESFPDYEGNVPGNLNIQ